MKRAYLNYIVDAGLALAFLTSVTTGITKWPGLFRFLGLTHRVFPMATISTIHDLSGITMAALVLVHLILHWSWIVSMTKDLFKAK